MIGKDGEEQDSGGGATKAKVIVRNEELRRLTGIHIYTVSIPRSGIARRSLRLASKSRAFASHTQLA